jgi:rhodanese-related sulfurtransferase
MSIGAYAGDILPKEAWELLARDQKAVLVDVRTPAEWNYVGVPDLRAIGKQPLFVPWLFFPSMELNAQFAEHVEAAGLERDAPILFLCRSGVRSRAAAVAMTARGFTTCYNIATGFEGDPDSNRHRGVMSGWKADGLAWAQS